MKTVKITSDNKISVIELDFDNTDSIMEAIGGYFETVSTERLCKYFKIPVVMIVDDDGHRKNLPINRLGCFFYATIKHGDPIVGDMILAVSADGDIGGYKDRDAETIKKRLIEEFEFLEDAGNGRISNLIQEACDGFCHK